MAVSVTSDTVQLPVLSHAKTYWKQKRVTVQHNIWQMCYLKITRVQSTSAYLHVQNRTFFFNRLPAVQKEDEVYTIKTSDGRLKVVVFFVLSTVSGTREPW